ncbi:hypothetical protein CQW23_15970 [Capsicum baccatum]|uniref:peptidylprolyl isomerase n=2 Tax=Capsicum TaxID=4071 RepID=A0A2G2ZDF6_CAPAN|nr:uncharacterized protein LOC124899362 [Capsicum annuum]KAF3632300.1 putative serine carboxypeptidase 3-like [Capsicum annuum]KAF3663376.1 putative serine carboxypeptidase 3-like [Capsicum annuum]PHT46812.1 hypothetical protein CQW23_15970 [Capsicum baccatum]PHT80047.1 hypothetical protein T459_18099 [Capsicum annuum]
MAMTITTAMASPSRRLLINSQHSTLITIPKNVAIFPATTAVTNQGLLNLNHSVFSQVSLRPLVKPVCAAGSGLEADLGDDESLIRVKNAKIVVESEDDDKIQVRVDVNEEDTRIVFEKVLTNLAKSAPPVPGFRREKGGKTSKVPRDFLLQILGEERVTNFVIREIVTSTLADYVKKENLTVKDNKISTTQTADELKSSFAPGTQFGFNAILELEKSKAEATT